MPVHEVGQTNSCTCTCQSQRCSVDDQRPITAIEEFRSMVCTSQR